MEEVKSPQMTTYRRLGKEDGDAYYRLLHAGYAINDAYGVDFSARHITKEEAAHWVMTYPTYGLFVGERLVSSISLRLPWSPLPGPLPYPHLGHVVTDAAYQGKGYARRMMTYIEALLKHELCSPVVTLGTADSHPWLRRMYESFGFVVFDTRQLPGKGHRTLYLKKSL